MRKIRGGIPTIDRLLAFASANLFTFSVSLTVLLFYYSILLPISHSMIGDPDTLWHLRTGQWILDHAQVPTIDFYSYTVAGKRWISTEWLAEILMALSYNIAEWHGVVILTVIACAVIIGIVCFYLVRNLRFSIAIGWTALTALAVSPHFLARPHIFSYILSVIWVIKLLESYDRDDFRSHLVSFCALMIIWANVHPSFTLGLVLFYIVIGYSCVERFLRRGCLRFWDELIAVGAISACALLTPYGVYSALLTVHTMNTGYTLSHLVEWRPPDFQQNRIQLFLMVGFLMALTVLGVRLRGPRLIMYGMMLILGLSYTRGLVTFYLFTPIILARPLADSGLWYQAAPRVSLESAQGTKLSSASDPVLPYIQRLSKMVPAFFLGVAIVVTVASWQVINRGPSGAIAPRAALDFVSKAGIAGNVFNSYNFGGYLIFRKIPTFVDGRAPPFTEQFLKEYFDAVKLADIKGAYKLLDRYKVTWALLSPSDPLAKALAESDQWKEVYSDLYSVVIVRSKTFSQKLSNLTASRMTLTRARLDLNGAAGASR